MRRRQLLAALGTTVPFAGCLSTATGDDSPGDSPTSTDTDGESPEESPTPTTESDIEIIVPTASPGETATITITAQSVTHIRFSDVPDIEATIEYENAKFSPPPSAVWERKPPTWQWIPAETVTGDVPLTVSESVPPGDYRYAIAVQQEDSEAEVIETFTVTVQT